MSLSPANLEQFRVFVLERSGLLFDDGKLELLASALHRRLLALNESATDYLNALDTPARRQTELRELAQELTVGETYFFRHTDQFRAFAEVALPARLEARAQSRELNLLSAGCSSGEEAYSLAILTQQRLPSPAWKVTIRGVDLNPKAVERAQLARYSSWALRETPEEIQQRYFSVEGREHVLASSIRDAVSFEQDNLLGDEPWSPEGFDIIFCRNVLMYFAPESAERVVRRLSRSLAAGGYLFLGHAENLRGLSQDFDLCHTHGTFYYRRKYERGRPPLGLGEREQAVTPFLARAAHGLDWTSTWLTTVQKSSDRIRMLTEKAPPKPSPALTPAPKTSLDLSLALELLSRERFAEALDVLSELPVVSARDADAVLLRAALLTHAGKLAAAESACADLLSLDALSSGAHYLLALCRERGGDLRAAMEHAQTASYLDPAFAMPHLHLGLMARRTGDRSTAQRELSQAVLLLQREDASRLLLFGGGFTRDGLVALCRSELERLGASP